MCNFPENALRGITKGKHIIEETGGVSFELFMPDTRTAQNRDDNGEEVSINWEDDEDALIHTLTCRNGQGGYRFPNGVVRITIQEMKRINRLQTLLDSINYERSPEENNLYHGNIVFRTGLTNRVKRMIANNLAASVSFVIKRDEILR